MGSTMRLFSILSLVIYVVAQIIDALAPVLFSEKPVNAFKVAVFPGPLPSVSILFIIPSSLPARLVSLQSLIFYLGLPVMMDTHKDKAMGYFIITIVISIIIFILIGTVSRAFGMGRMGWM
jgi:hypothetical protein